MMTFLCEDGIVKGVLALRAYQEESIARVLEVYQRQPQGGRALIVLPTGGGKTVVFAEIARRLALQTLVIAHREELLRQAAEKFRLVDPRAIVGQLGAGKHEWYAPITVASIQTLSRSAHLARLRACRYGLVVIDECHHSAAAGYQAVLQAMPEAFVLGVTATPDRLDGADITSIFGSPVFMASIVEMVSQGYLCDLRALAIKTDTSLDDLHTQAGDFKQDELQQRIDTCERNERIVEAYLRHARDRQTLCFAVTVAHATHLAEAFNAQGVQAAMICGETPPEERRRLLLAYERGEIAVLCNVGVLTEGYDAPATSCIILARPTQSRGLFVQCLGRGLRLAPGKRDCLLLDITDNCLKHRLQPVTVSQALDIKVEPGRSLLETLVEKQTAQEHFAGDQPAQKGRKLCIKQRVDDLEVNLLGDFSWRRLANGMYELVAAAHRIRLVPLPNEPGNFAVWARLHPDPRPQCWLKSAPLDWAQQHAEAKASQLLTSEETRVLVDAYAPWRRSPATPKQLELLKIYAIPHAPGVTRGEASDLIEYSNLRRQWKKRGQ